MRKEDIGPTLKGWRERAGLRQHELADALGVSRQQVGQIETGKSGTRFDTLLEWARICEADLLDLFVDEKRRGIMAKMTRLTDEEADVIEQLVDAFPQSRSVFLEFLKGLLGVEQARIRGASERFG